MDEISIDKITKNTIAFMWYTINSFINGKILFSDIDPTLNEYLELQLKEKRNI